MNRRTPKARIALLLAFAVLIAQFAAGSAHAQSQTEKVIRVGWCETGAQAAYDGYASVSTTRVFDTAIGAHGYEYEYLQVLSQFTGWTYEYVYGTWDECLTRLANGEIDLLGFVSKIPEREALFGYPKLPMAVTDAWLVISNTNYDMGTSPADIDGKVVGVVKGSAFNALCEAYCQENAISVTYKPFQTFTDVTSALQSGEVDAAVFSDEDMTASEQGLIKLSSSNQYYVTSIDNQELLAELDDAMMQMFNYWPDMNSDLRQKYLNVNVNGKLVFTAAEEKFIREHPQVQVVFNSDWPPIEYFDEKIGAYTGISPELFKLLSQKCGIDFIYEGSANGEVPTAPQIADRPNVLTTFFYNYDWANQQDVYITQPFIASSIVKLGDNPDAENPTVAMNKNGYLAFLLKDELQNVNVRHYATHKEQLEAVWRGEADYIFVTEDQANYYSSIPRYSVFSIQKIMGRAQEICISISKSSAPELVSIIAKTLAGISHDEITEIIMRSTADAYRWTVDDFIYEYRVPLITLTIVFISLIACLIALYVHQHRSVKQLKNAYEQKEEALAMAQQASSAKGDFMSRMSHEIRTPLNAIIGYNTIARSSLIEAKTDADRRHADMGVMDCLTKSDLASKHLLTIINDVLDMSAIESGKMKVAQEKFDFKNLISSLTVLFFSQAKAKGVDFEVLFDKPTEEWYVGDQMRINQILTNLLSNAVKFTPEDGSVKLKITQQTTDEQTTGFRFVVSDTGIGMTKEYLGHIWAPFEQADATITRRFGGTGLGLSITKNLVDMMNGSISVESASGKGTVFTVDLTLKRTEQPYQSGAYDFSGVNALVVDDDIHTCEYIKLLFDRCGASCVTVTSGDLAVSAFTAAQEQKHPFTVCLIDWRMPRMDGLHTVKRIREVANDDVPMMIVTAYDYAEIAEKADESDITMFISKPLFQSSLFDLLVNISGRQAPVKKLNKNKKFDFNGARVLLAEDNKMNMEVARRILESVGISVDSAWNGQEAIDKFMASKKGAYLAILMDVHMPKVDGYQATRVIRASRHPEAASIPIIAMTADAFAEDVSEAHSSGMNDHISKPIDIPTLIAALTKYAPQ